MVNPYEQDLDKNPANHQPLTPLSFLERAAKTFPGQTAIIHGSQRISYRDFWRRSLKLASALARRGIGKGDTVTVMLSNTPPMLEAHFGVPMVKAVLHSLNTRLDAAVIAFQLDHAETKVLIVDREFSGVVREALALAKVKPLVIDYDDPEYADDAPYPKGERIGSLDYEAFVGSGEEDFAWSMPDDEWDAISLNYTSGTTGNPKGVVYHHRGAALMAYTNTIHAGMGKHCVYLWTLPMFHCNGWCFPWTLAVQAGTHVCLRWVRARAMYDAIADHGLLPENWQQRLPHDSSPYTSTIVFLVRKGNPKHIEDWDDLVKGDVQVVTPNPKTSGGARWNFLAAWAYALEKSGGSEDQAKQFVKQLLQHVPVLDSGARGATTTFVERGEGDVLLAWENEAFLAQKELGPGKFDIVWPSLSILAEPPVAVVDKVVDRKGTRDAAQALLEFLYTPQAQDIIARNGYRPIDKAVAAKYAGSFPTLKLVTIDDPIFGGWRAAQKRFFSDGGIFDQIYQPRR